MQTIVILTAFLLVAGVSAEQPQEVSNVQTVPVQVNQPSHVVGHSSSVESGPQTGPVHQHFTGGQLVGFEHQVQHAPQYYSPAGMMQVVGSQSEQQQQSSASQGQKPVVGHMTVGHYAAAAAAPAGTPEQYGQPESASIPPNYKPFGSWGLYIGGNPADGYYTNYYKALSNSVADKQQVSGVESSSAGQKPTGSQAFVGQASGFGASGAPMMKQGPFYPQSVSYQDAGYPYGEYYTPADLNSGSRVQVQNPTVYSSAPAGYITEYPQAPQSPASPGAAAMYYGADSYAATKKVQQQAFAQKEVQAPLSPAKGYQQQQQRVGYAYASQSAYQAPVTVHQASYQPQPQVVAYPVPVGSQIVGSQPGAEGSYQPYGVHGFTRYAVKPTVVSSVEQSYYPTGVHSAPAGQFPVYKQQFVGYQQPMSFYGYPLSQLHYSTGAVSPVFGAQSSPSAQTPAGSPAAPATFSTGVQHPAGPQGVTVVEHSGPVVQHGPAGPVEAASSEKSETSSEADKQVNKQQKRA